METKDEPNCSDLEDGEIREDPLEDISDCSMSEIVTIKKDLEGEEDVDVDFLREEALKSMYKCVEEENDEEIEEEQYRLEALKSLLTNIELSEKKCSDEEVDRKRKVKRKRRHESNRRRKKLRADALHSPRVIENGDSLDRRKTVTPPPQKIVNEKKLSSALPASRPWYPKAHLTLIPQLIDEDKPKSETTPTSTRKPMNSVQPVPARVVSYATQVSPSKNRIMKNYAPKSPFMKLNNFRKVTKHCIRKFDSTLSVNRVNSFTPQNGSVGKGKYKLVNKSNYVINNVVSPTVNGIRNHSSSASPYSVNRLKSPQVCLPPKKFIIELDDDDDSNNEAEALKCNGNLDGGAGITPVCDIEANRDKISTMEQPKETARICDQGESKLVTSKSSATLVDIDRKRVNTVCQIPVQCESSSNRESSSTDPRDDNQSTERRVQTERDEEKTKCASPKIESKATPSDLVNTNGKDMSLLLEAEACLIRIRQKLITDLDELDKSMKQNATENEKLSTLSKKLCVLKSMVAKLETKIELQQSRLSASAASLNCLFSGVQTRTLTCSKFEEVCRIAGRNLLGTHYQPPNELESVIAEKRKTIDFNKCQSAADLKFVTTPQWMTMK